MCSQKSVQPLQPLLCSQTVVSAAITVFVEPPVIVVAGGFAVYGTLKFYFLIDRAID